MLQFCKIAEAFYYAGYIEKWGRGTLKIIDECKKINFPEPEFIDDGSSFKVIFRKDILTEEYLRKLGLNERQIKAIVYVKEKGKITNKEYQLLINTNRITAMRDLQDLVKKSIVKMEGTGKRNIQYRLFIDAKMMQK
ncbi:MAG: ATP-binding protein [Elusimicrobiota bacterium]